MPSESSKCNRAIGILAILEIRKRSARRGFSISACLLLCAAMLYHFLGISEVEDASKLGPLWILISNFVSFLFAVGIISVVISALANSAIFVREYRLKKLV